MAHIGIVLLVEIALTLAILELTAHFEIIWKPMKCCLTEWGVMKASMIAPKLTLYLALLKVWVFNLKKKSFNILEMLQI